MTAGKSDALRKRLLSAGLSSDAITKYVDTLRAFLSARMTKCRYEDEMSKVLPKDKIHVHNEIIQEILSRAQQKREGVPDLPLIIPLRDKRPAVSKRFSNLKAHHGAAKTENVKVRIGNKRPHEEVESEARKVGPSDDAVTANLNKKAKIKAVVPKKTTDVDKTKIVKVKASGIEKASPKPIGRRKGADSTSNIATPSGNVVNVTRMAPPKSMQVPVADIPTYDGLPYFPGRPGQAMDFELFLRLQQRMRRVAIEQFGMSGLKDDAVGIMVHGVESHVKSLMEAAARQRVSRDGVRPHRNLQCGPVRAYDFRESTKRNTMLLGDEAGMDLERLSMLL